MKTSLQIFEFFGKMYVKQLNIRFFRNFEIVLSILKLVCTHAHSSTAVPRNSGHFCSTSRFSYPVETAGLRVACQPSIHFYVCKANQPVPSRSVHYSACPLFRGTAVFAINKNIFNPPKLTRKILHFGLLRLPTN